jgi:hypothetical protein
MRYVHVFDFELLVSCACVVDFERHALADYFRPRKAIFIIVFNVYYNFMLTLLFSTVDSDFNLFTQIQKLTVVQQAGLICLYDYMKYFLNLKDYIHSVKAICTQVRQGRIIRNILFRHPQVTGYYLLCF